MCGWFICGNCANVAKTFFKNRKIFDALRIEVPKKDLSLFFD